MKEILGEQTYGILAKNIHARLYNYVEKAEITLEIPDEETEGSGYSYYRTLYDHKGLVKEGGGLTSPDSTAPKRYEHLVRFLEETLTE